MEDCDLYELPVEGPRLTWYRGNGSNVVYKRLDRGLCSNDWLDRFPYAIEEHLKATTSDHLPICIHVPKHQEHRRMSSAKLKFENVWVRNEECAKVIEEAWNNGEVGCTGRL